jgi:hypothetical protein
MPNKSLFQEAISELCGQIQLHPKVVNGRIVGDFIAYLLTGDKHSAKMLWKNTLRARVFSTCMDMLLIQEIDEFLDM